MAAVVDCEKFNAVIIGRDPKFYPLKRSLRLQLTEQPNIHVFDIIWPF